MGGERRGLFRVAEEFDKLESSTNFSLSILWFRLTELGQTGVRGNSLSGVAIMGWPRVFISMKEIREILDRVAAFGASDRGVVATVIDVRGSGYRLPGARMLILASGDSFGTVSGGCLEADVLERAKNVIATGRAEVFTYDTTADETSVFSLNMGCRGVIRILLESVGRENRLINKLRNETRTRRHQAVATLISAETPTDAAVGGRVFLGDRDKAEIDALPQFLADLPEFHDAFTRFSASGSAYDSETFETPEGKFEFAFENIEPPISMLLFGAGADAIPVVRIVNELGWQVTVYDHRPAFLTAERFPFAEKLTLQNSDEPLQPVDADARTAAVIMTHNYARDKFILPALLRSDAFFIGALGPKHRTEQLLEELAASGETFAEDELARLYAPAGLDIGADTPESIALSIVSEIQSVIASRDGGHLRNRTGSIYDRH